MAVVNGWDLDRQWPDGPPEGLDYVVVPTREGPLRVVRVGPFLKNVEIEDEYGLFAGMATEEMQDWGWKDPARWRDGRVPVDGDTVVLPNLGFGRSPLPYVKTAKDY